MDDRPLRSRAQELITTALADATGFEKHPLLGKGSQQQPPLRNTRATQTAQPQWSGGSLKPPPTKPSHRHHPSLSSPLSSSKVRSPRSSNSLAQQRIRSNSQPLPRSWCLDQAKGGSRKRKRAGNLQKCQDSNWGPLQEAQGI